MAESAPEKRLVGENGGVRVEVESNGPVISTLSIEVEAKRVKKAFDRAYKDIGKQAQVKGFRPGKVPKSVDAREDATAPRCSARRSSASWSAETLQ